jgi:hypothetical protein
MTELTKAGQKAVAEGAKAADVLERQMLSHAVSGRSQA